MEEERNKTIHDAIELKRFLEERVKVTQDLRKEQSANVNKVISKVENRKNEIIKAEKRVMNGIEPWKEK